MEMLKQLEEGLQLHREQQEKLVSFVARHRHTQTHTHKKKRPTSIAKETYMNSEQQDKLVSFVAIKVTS